MEVNKREKLREVRIRIARKWKNYFSLEGLIPNVYPTDEQKQVVQSNEKQLIIQGSAGSGKSLMLVYRLIKLMEQYEESQKVLYVTFNQVLIDDTIKKLKQSSAYKNMKDKHNIEILTYHDVVRKILMNYCGFEQITKIKMIKKEIEKHESQLAAYISIVLERVQNLSEFIELEPLFLTHTPRFLLEEFLWMKANGITTKDKYLNCKRTGRGIQPQVLYVQRPTIFYLFEKYNEFLKTNFRHPFLDIEDYALILLNELKIKKDVPFKYDHILVDEFQDLQPMQIKSLVALTRDSITLVGDDKQRIYKRSPLSYKELNLNVNRRTSQKLSKNFRSTKQIMNLASSLKFIDVENVREDDQEFIREGNRPSILYYLDDRKLARRIITEIKKIHKKEPEKTIAIIHRYNDNELKRENNIKSILQREFDIIGINSYGRRFNYDRVKKPIFFTTPYEVKGLEFDYVFIIHFDGAHYPLAREINNLDEKYGGTKWRDSNYKIDRADIENNEKKLLYVACSRAREELFLLYSGKTFRYVSPFIRDFNLRDYKANFKKSVYKE